VHKVQEVTKEDKVTKDHRPQVLKAQLVWLYQALQVLQDPHLKVVKDQKVSKVSKVTKVLLVLQDQLVLKDLKEVLVIKDLLVLVVLQILD
jgi:hypothetical protein